MNAIFLIEAFFFKLIKMYNIKKNILLVAASCQVISRTLLFRS